MYLNMHLRPGALSGGSGERPLDRLRKPVVPGLSHGGPQSYGEQVNLSCWLIVIAGSGGR